MGIKYNPPLVPTKRPMARADLPAPVAAGCESCEEFAARLRWMAKIAREKGIGGMTPAQLEEECRTLEAEADQVEKIGAELKVN